MSRLRTPIITPDGGQPRVQIDVEGLRKRRDEILRRHLKLGWQDFLHLMATEAFEPTFPPKLNFLNYPMRDGRGVIITHQTSFGWEADNLLIVSHAEDGRTFTTVHGTLPRDGIVTHWP